jgi:hypothetical protein
MNNLNGTTSDAYEEQLEMEIDRLKRALALFQDRVALLEEENTAFAGMLKERGVDVRASSKISLELPPPIRTRTNAVDEMCALMTAEERRLLEEICPNAGILALWQSDSDADVGYWFIRRQVWICAGQRELTLLACGRRPFIQQVPFTHLRKSLYNHVTGELVLAPPEELKMSRIKLPALAGYQVLAQIYDENPNQK